MPAPQPPSLQQDWSTLAEMDPNAEMMGQGATAPMNRQNYIDAEQVGQEPPAEWTQEDEMGLPPQLQGFEGVGLSETPQGPMPIPEGRMGGGPQPELEKAQEPPALQKAQMQEAPPPGQIPPARPSKQQGGFWQPSKGG